MIIYGEIFEDFQGVITRCGIAWLNGVTITILMVKILAIANGGMSARLLFHCFKTK